MRIVIPEGDGDQLSTSDQDNLRSLQQIQQQAQQPADVVALLYQAVEASRNGIVVTDPNQPDNPIIYANKSFSELTGYRIDQILGRNCRFLQRDDRNQDALADIREAIRSERSVTTILKNYRKNGTLFWNELTISPVHDGEGRLINFVGIQNDVSARKEAEKRVSEFYSVISHELRTPLTSINGALHAISDGSAGRVNATAAKLLKIALDNSERLMRLISDILDWKKIEAGRIKLHLQEVDAESLIDEVINALSPIAATASVRLVKEMINRRTVILDRDRTMQVLSNLTSNAIKFSPKNGHIILRVESPSADTTRFSIIDQGPGIAQEQLPKLFGRFQQIDSSDNRQKGGTGLGLAISKSLVELHGGHIGVINEQGKGCTFWFEIFDG